jgi:4-amino-4-deoxy-L-arabinose transferase-like glycosyltransferase
MKKRSVSTVTGDQVILFLILAVALIARFRYLLYIEHNVDHAYTVWQAMRTVDLGVFPLTGQRTSVLFDNPPLTGYLLTPVWMLTRSPLGVYVFIISLNWLSVWLTYRATRILAGGKLALVTSGLMAVNPWVVEYSRTSWAQSLLPFFVCAVAWLLWPVLMGKSRRPIRRTILALLCMTALTQTYLLAFFMVAPVAILIIVFRRRLPLQGVLVGAGIFIIATSVFAVGLLAQASGVQQGVDKFSSNEPQFSMEAWNHGVRLVTGHQYEVARRRNTPDADFNLRHNLTELAHLPLLVSMLLGIGVASVAIFRKDEKRDAAIILLVWFGLPVVAMSYTTQLVHPTYQLLGLPAGYILAAWGLEVVFRPNNSYWGNVALVVLGIPFAALMLTNSSHHYKYIADNPGAEGFDAMPVKLGLEVGDVIDDYLPPGGVVFANAPEWVMNSFSNRFFSVSRDMRIPRLTYLPGGGGMYINIGMEETLSPFGSTHVRTINLPDGNVITFDLLPPAAQTTLPTNILNIPSHQGIVLHSYDLSLDGDIWTLTTAWRVDFVAEEVYERIFGTFIHVFDVDGNNILIVDGEGMDGWRWNPGDVHVHQLSFLLPDEAKGPFTLNVGQYDGIHNANIIFVLPEGDNSVITLPETLP